MKTEQLWQSDDWVDPLPFHNTKNFVYYYVESFLIVLSFGSASMASLDSKLSLGFVLEVFSLTPYDLTLFIITQ